MVSLPPPFAQLFFLLFREHKGWVQIGLISDQTQFSTVGLVELKKNLHNLDSGRAHFMERPGKMVFFFFVVFFLIICLNFAAFCLISGL